MDRLVELFKPMKGPTKKALTLEERGFDSVNYSRDSRSDEGESSGVGEAGEAMDPGEMEAEIEKCFQGHSEMG